MKLGARLLETIVLLTGYDYHLPADIYLHHALKEKRYIGGSDRRFIRECFYKILRHQLFLESLLERLSPHQKDQHGRNMMMVYGALYQKDWLACFNGERYHPPALVSWEREMLENIPHQLLHPCHTDEEKAATLNLPPFWYRHLTKSFGDKLVNHMHALNKVAPLDLRIHSLRLSQKEALSLAQKKGAEPSPAPFSPFGLRLFDHQLFDQELVTKGFMEPQDVGSQIITLACDVAPKMRVADFCAGAGGKTLSLSMLMRNQGTIVALDVESKRLKRAQERFRRLGLHNITPKIIEPTWIKRQKHSFDRVLVDAPCSGSGTWRRNPDLKIRVQEKELKQLLQTQQDILRQASALVKPGGRLIYATCSLLMEENDDQIHHFLSTDEGQRFRLFDIAHHWSRIIEGAIDSTQHTASFPTPCTTPMFHLTPLEHNTDGFFVAVLEAIELP